jgi:hypothetical protein
MASAAFDPFGGVDCGGARANSAVCTSRTTEDPISGPNGVLLKITNIVAFIAGAAAIIVVIVGSIKFITSNGDANNISSAKKTIINAVIGLAVIIIGRTLVIFIINSL